MRVAVDGDVVVHGVGSCGAGGYAGEDAGVEDAHEWFGGLGWAYASGQDLGCFDAGVVEFFVGVSSFDQGAAFEGDTGEETFGFRVGKYTGNSLETGGAGGFSVSTNRSCGYGYVATESQGTLL